VDVIVHDAVSVQMPPPGTVKFDIYKPLPNVQRGLCTHCNQAVIEVFKTPLFPALTIVPAAMFKTASEVPAPSAHIFYDKQVEDATDN